MGGEIWGELLERERVMIGRHVTFVHGVEWEDEPAMHRAWWMVYEVEAYPGGTGPKPYLRWVMKTEGHYGVSWNSGIF